MKCRVPFSNLASFMIQESKLYGSPKHSSTSWALPSVLELSSWSGCNLVCCLSNPPIGSLIAETRRRNFIEENHSACANGSQFHFDPTFHRVTSPVHNQMLVLGLVAKWMTMTWCSLVDWFHLPLSLLTFMPLGAPLIPLMGRKSH